jgi:hypothetical protein
MQQPFSNELVAGDSWLWQYENVLDACGNAYDPSLYSLKFYLRGPSKLDLTSTVVGSAFQFSAAATDTADLAGGVYAWQLKIVATDASSTTELARGEVKILEDLSKKDNFDARSFVKRTLDAIELALADVATHTMSEYQVTGEGGGRMIKYIARDELLTLHGVFKWRYRNEQIESGELDPDVNEVRAAFGNPSHSNGWPGGSW